MASMSLGFVLLRGAHARRRFSRTPSPSRGRSSHNSRACRRLAIRRLGNRNGLDSAARERAAQALIARAERSGQPGLAEHLRAYQLNASGALPGAIAAFEEAARIKPLPPDWE